MVSMLIRRIRIFQISMIALLLVRLVSAQQRSIDDFFRDYSADWVRHDPSLATSTRFFSGPEQNRLERQITPQTLAWKRDRIERARRGLAELRKFDTSRMTESQRVSAEVMQWQLQNAVNEEPYLDYTFPLEQFQGANVQLVNVLIVGHPLITATDAENYVAAMGEVGLRLREAMAESQRIAAKGIVPPKFILQLTIQQMQRFTAGNPAQNPFVTVLAQKMEAMKSLPEAKRSEIRAQAEKVVSAQVYPAYKSAIALLESQIPRATDDAGLWRLEAGPEAYTYFLHRYTTTNMTAEQIHELGLRQVQTIEAQMDKIFQSLGRTKGSVQDRITELQKEMAYPNPASPESREQVMRDIAVILRDAQQRSAMLFDKRPAASIAAQPYPDFQEANNAPRSVPPSPDGSRPGIFLFPRSGDWMTKFGLRSITYHEAVPGHFFQMGLQIEDKNLPRFRQYSIFPFISASGEGWGLYAERLAAESGWYDGDLQGLLGQLNFELFRARRLVVDTGIHAMHWTRQQSINYGIQPSEVERYVVLPGQACSYMIGELKILELRDKARKALRDKFSLKAFHNVVLGTGNVPLDVLEQQIDSYIKANAG